MQGLDPLAEPSCFVFINNFKKNNEQQIIVWTYFIYQQHQIEKVSFIHQDSESIYFTIRMCKQIRTQSSFKSTNQNKVSSLDEKPRRSIKFDTVEVRSYSRILGDNPACTGGPPTQLGWDYNVECNTTLDDYEEKRQPLRPRIELALTPFMRRYSMHNDFGFSHEEITIACKGIQKIRKQRARSKRSVLRMEKRFWAVGKMLRRIGNTFRKKKIHYGVGASEITRK